MFWRTLSFSPGRNKNFLLKFSDRLCDTRSLRQRIQKVKRLTTDIYLILRLRMSGTIPLFPPRRLHDVLRDNLTFYCSQHAKYLVPLIIKKSVSILLVRCRREFWTHWLFNWSVCCSPCLDMR